MKTKDIGSVLEELYELLETMKEIIDDEVIFGSLYGLWEEILQLMDDSGLLATEKQLTEGKTDYLKIDHLLGERTYSFIMDVEQIREEIRQGKIAVDCINWNEAKNLVYLPETVLQNENAVLITTLASQVNKKRFIIIDGSQRYINVMNNHKSEYFYLLNPFDLSFSCFKDIASWTKYQMINSFRELDCFCAEGFAEGLDYLQDIRIFLCSLMTALRKSDNRTINTKWMS